MLVSSSSFFLATYLVTTIKYTSLTEKQLVFVRQNNVTSTFPFLVNQSRQGSKEWLNYMGSLATIDPQYAIQLAEYYVSIERELAAELWLKQAIKLGDYTAKFKLAEFYLTQKKLLRASVLLDDVITHEKASTRKDINTHLLNEALKLQITIAVETGDLLLINTLSALLVKDPINAVFYQQLIKYDVPLPSTTNKYNEPENALIGKDCKNRIAFFATSLTNLNRISDLIKTVKAHSISARFCFNEPRYIPKNLLNCLNEPDEAIRCDESLWLSYIKDETARYIAVMLDEGGANVHLGILYLAYQDTAGVLAHELAHFTGFIDEYKLPATHKFCRNNGNESANNIVRTDDIIIDERSREVIRAEILLILPWADQILPATKILTLLKSPVLASGELVEEHTKAWRVGTPDYQSDKVGLFPAKTCENNSVHTFKPTAEASFMEHYELAYPPVYQRIEKNLRGKFAMPSYHYNIALSLFNKGDEKGARQLLLQAAGNEEDTERRAKIAIGDL